MRDVDENEEAGEDVGRPVAATDDGVLPLTYRLDGPDAGLFDFNPSLSQIRTKRGVTYNHEDPACGYVDTDKYNHMHVLRDGDSLRREGRK